MGDIERCEILVLSPHLDDAVFSCAGFLLDAIEKGQSVTVATMFTDGRRGDQYFAQRRAEDERALNSLGAQLVWCGFVDASARFQDANLCTSAPEPELQRLLLNKAESLLSAAQPRTLLLPLGVGAHVDHLSLHEVVAISSGDLDVLFYEERPYVFRPAALISRLFDLGLVPNIGIGSNLCSELDLREFVQSKIQDDSANNATTDLRAVLRFASCLKTDVPSNANIFNVVHIAGEDARTRIAELAQLYSSQFAETFGSLHSWKENCSNYSRLIGSEHQYGERYWRHRSNGIQIS